MWPNFLTNYINRVTSRQTASRSAPPNAQHRFLTRRVRLEQLESRLLLSGVSADEYPTNRTIDFSGMTWDVKNGYDGPGPNHWSDSTDNVWVDSAGLHLAITKSEGTWYCAEVFTQESFGYGEYVFYVSRNVENYDKNIVVGLFTYLDQNNEIDIEFSRWGDSGNEEAGQYVIQPYYETGNMERFRLGLTGDYSTHRFNWQEDKVFFQSYHGHYPNLPSAGHLIHQWTYTGSDIPVPGGEKLRLNLWLFYGSAPSNSQPAELVVAGVEVHSSDATLGLYDPTHAAFHLKNSNTQGGGADIVFRYGPRGNHGWIPLTGDWDNVGEETVGLYDPSTGVFHLKNCNGNPPPGADVVFSFGPRDNAGWQPITGDWDGDGIDTVGLYDPNGGAFHLKNINANLPRGADIVFRFGPRGLNNNCQAIAGDWDGDGIDTVGLYDPNGAGWHLKNSNQAGPPDIAPFRFGPRGNRGWHPLAGDWDSDGTGSVGLYDPATAAFHLKHTNACLPGGADIVFQYGPRGNRGWLPLSGDWDGPGTSPGAAAGAVAWDGKSLAAAELAAVAEAFSIWDNADDRPVHKSQAAHQPSLVEIDAYFGEL